MELTALNALSPVDGRYASKVDDLRPIFSEYGLIRHRILVEIRWLQALADEPGIAEVPPLSEHAVRLLDGIFDGFSEEDAQRVKNIESSSTSSRSASPATPSLRRSPSSSTSPAPPRTSTTSPTR